MKQLELVTSAIMAQMPPEARFQAADQQCLFAHQEQLLALEDQLVKGFYDVLFAHPPTQAIFHDGERAAREASLRQWWRRTLAGPFDDSYWAWQTLVGIMHVKRRVKNPMMIAMWGWILNTVRQALQGTLPDTEVAEVLGALERLAATVQALIAESYQQHYIAALCDATGYNPRMLDRLVAAEIESFLSQRLKAE